MVGQLTKRDKDGKLGKPEKEWKKFDEAKVKDLLRAYKALTAEDYGEAKDKAASGLDKAEENGGVVHIKLKDNAGDLTVKVGKVVQGHQPLGHEGRLATSSTPSPRGPPTGPRPSRPSSRRTTRSRTTRSRPRTAGCRRACDMPGMDGE